MSKIINGEDGVGINIIVSLDDTGYGEFTNAQIEQIKNYCLRFGESGNSDSIPDGFNLVINSIPMDIVNWTTYNGELIIQGCAFDKVDFSIGLGDNYIIFTVELSFPLYLTVPFIQYTPAFGNTKEYILQNSEILTKLWDFLCQNVVLDNGDNKPWGTWYVPDNFCNDYPIYLNNIKITDIFGDFNLGDDINKPSMLLFLGADIYECSVTEDNIYLYVHYTQDQHGGGSND